MWIGNCDPRNSLLCCFRCARGQWEFYMQSYCHCLSAAWTFSTCATAVSSVWRSITSAENYCMSMMQQHKQQQQQQLQDQWIKIKTASWLFPAASRNDLPSCFYGIFNSMLLKYECEPILVCPKFCVLLVWLRAAGVVRQTVMCLLCLAAWFLALGALLTWAPYSDLLITVIKTGLPLSNTQSTEFGCSDCSAQTDNTMSPDNENKYVLFYRICLVFWVVFFLIFFPKSTNRFSCISLFPLLTVNSRHGKGHFFPLFSDVYDKLIFLLIQIIFSMLW